jgi:hypothetical protein
MKAVICSFFVLLAIAVSALAQGENFSAFSTRCGLKGNNLARDTRLLTKSHL